MTCDTYRRAVDRAARYANARDGKLETAERFLAHAGWADSTFGIESVGIGGYSMEYLNPGDTYDTTVIRENGICFVGCWGDWYQDAETKYCDDNDYHYCPNCGECSEAVESLEYEFGPCDCCGCDDIADNGDCTECEGRGYDYTDYDNPTRNCGCCEYEL